MKYFFLNVVQRIKEYSKQLDTESILYNKNWIVFNNSADQEQFIFRPNKELLIVKNGIASKARWELLTAGIILVEIGEVTYLFNAVFHDNLFLVLQLDGNKNYLILFDRSLIINNTIETIEDIEKELNKKYTTKTQSEMSLKIQTKEDIEKEKIEKQKKLEEVIAAKSQQNKQTLIFIFCTIAIIIILSIIASL